MTEWRRRRAHKELESFAPSRSLLISCSDGARTICQAVLLATAALAPQPGGLDVLVTSPISLVSSVRR